MKKKLLFIIDSLDCGGAEKSLVSLLPLIDFSKYNVDLLILDVQRDKHKGVFEKYIPAEVNVLDYHLFGKTVFEKIRKFFLHARLSPQLRLNHRRHGSEIYWRSAHFDHKYLKKHYDVGIAYQQGIPTFFLATKVDATKKIAWINADLYNEGFDMDYCHRFYDKMDHVVVVSPRLQGIMGQGSPWLKNKLTCIYDVVNQELIRQMAQEVIDDKPQCDGGVIIVTAGRLALPKNYLLAVETARVLRDRDFDFKWYFVGDGPTRKSIENKIEDYCLKDKVILLGFKDNPYPYISMADVYVQTSSHEGFCLTIAEAKTLYRPVVTTDFDVVFDQITDRHNGLIAKMTPESLADSIMEISRDRILRNSIVQHLEREVNNTTMTEIEKLDNIIEN